MTRNIKLNNLFSTCVKRKLNFNCKIKMYTDSQGCDLTKYFTSHITYELSSGNSVSGII